ncbi:MAG TPA: DUF6544 family protein [Ktedonobacteraceae bacterium]|nr:DUF6544 family protein [Ktedonobacteraceae bacterium]
MKDQVLRLPEAVQRYLNYAQVVGKEPIRSVRLKQRGEYRMKPGQKWLPFVAEQRFTTNPPAFLWHMTSRPFPLVSISVKDRFSSDHGDLLVQLWSLVPLSHARGPEIDQGELQRYLLESAWFPTAWLSDAITWQAVDDHTAKATIHLQGLTAEGEFHVDEQGQVAHVTAQRYIKEHGRYQLEPWSGRFSEYREADGMRIPTSFEVAWHLAAGDFSWLRASVTEIEYNQSGKVTAF